MERPRQFQREFDGFVVNNRSKFQLCHGQFL